MAAPRFITPLELAVLAWPANVRASDLGAGRTGMVARALTGTGGLVVSGAAFDAHQAVVEIVTGGVLGTATFRYQTDSTTWSDEHLTAGQEQDLLHTAPDDITGGAATGLGVTFTAGNFVALDRWTWSTKPVQAFVAAILAASADAASLLSGPQGGGRYTGDLAIADAGLKQDTAVLARLILLEKRGFDPTSPDGQLYIGSAVRARAKLIEVAEKKRHPFGVSEQGPERFAPDVYAGADRGGIAAAQRGRRG